MLRLPVLPTHPDPNRPRRRLWTPHTLNPMLRKVFAVQLYANSPPVPNQSQLADLLRWKIQDLAEAASSDERYESLDLITVPSWASCSKHSTVEEIATAFLNSCELLRGLYRIAWAREARPLRTVEARRHWASDVRRGQHLTLWELAELLPSCNDDL